MGDEQTIFIYEYYRVHEIRVRSRLSRFGPGVKCNAAQWAASGRPVTAKLIFCSVPSWGLMHKRAEDLEHVRSDDEPFAPRLLVAGCVLQRMHQPPFRFIYCWGIGVGCEGGGTRKRGRCDHSSVSEFSGRRPPTIFRCAGESYPNC